MSHSPLQCYVWLVFAVEGVSVRGQDGAPRQGAVRRSRGRGIAKVVKVVGGLALIGKLLGVAAKHGGRDGGHHGGHHGGQHGGHHGDHREYHR